MSDIGHNAQSPDRIKSFAERIERLHEEKKAIEGDLKEVYAELAGEGYDKKAMRECIRLRAQDPEKRSTHEALVELYLTAVGDRHGA